MGSAATGREALDEVLQELAPEVNPGLIANHLARLDESYFARFAPTEIASHLAGLARLSPEHPLELLVQSDKRGLTACTFLAFDARSAFSLLTGVLAGLGFTILEGAAFTYAAAPPALPLNVRRRPSATGPGSPRVDPLRRRRLVDVFIGFLPDVASMDDWEAELRARATEAITLLESPSEKAAEQAKRRVNEWVVHGTPGLIGSTSSAIQAVEISLEPKDAYTRLRVVSRDTPAFLYSLSAALSLHGVSIERVQIRTSGDRVEDDLDLLDAGGHPIEAPGDLDRIRLAALLTKQFTSFLAAAADPYTALMRFDSLSQRILLEDRSARWIDIFSDPRAMPRLARALGASDFLWEDFIRLNYDALLPILAGQRWSDEGQARLALPLDPQLSYELRRELINRYKDRASALIELDSIVSDERDGHSLARRLTRLAEEVVMAACQAAYEHLLEQPGAALPAQGTGPFALLALGKFGAGGLGYASDLELLLVFRDEWENQGTPGAGAAFFSSLMHQLDYVIESKRDGLFQIDTRLRPFGRDGPLACRLDAFSSYYGPGGPAHSLERLALTRLRAVAGDAAFGVGVEQLRDRLIYETPWLNLAELREVRDRQFRQKHAGEKNAKYSPGALVDVEYGVQILQVQHGGSFPELRTPRIRQAIEGLRNRGLLLPAQATELQQAYDFLTRLINALRMLHGRSTDLFLPQGGSEEALHLARRMGYTSDKSVDAWPHLQIDFESHTSAVRAFTATVYEG